MALEWCSSGIESADGWKAVVRALTSSVSFGGGMKITNGCKWVEISARNGAYGVLETRTTLSDFLPVKSGNSYNNGTRIELKAGVTRRSARLKIKIWLSNESCADM